MMNTYQVELRSNDGARWTEFIVAESAIAAGFEAENMFDAECIGSFLAEGPIPEEIEIAEYGDGMTDAEADADTLRSAGMGTDEDYGYYGSDDDY